MLLVLVGCLVLAAFFTWLILVENRLAKPLLFFTITATAVLSIGIELLSLLHGLTLGNVRIALIASVLFCGIVTFRLRDGLVSAPGATPSSGVFLDGQATLNKNDILGRLGLSCAALLVFFVLTATAFTALSSVPNNWDSMTYHLPRIEHWLQNKGLQFYPTSNSRQLEFAVLAEQLIMTLRSLYESYRLANMVQWLSFCGCMLAANGVVRELGGTRAAQIMSAVMISTLPMAILQSSSTQTDLVVAFFSISSVHYLLRMNRGQSCVPVYGAVLAAALAYHAKGTAAVFLLGFAAVYGVRWLIESRSTRHFAHVVAAALLAVLIVSPQLYRNVERFGSPFGPESQLTMASEPSWRAAAFNLVRNFASNIRADAAVPWVASAGQALDVSDKDKRYSFMGYPFSVVAPGLVTHEDVAPNPAHLWLLLGGGVLLVATFVFARRKTDSRELAWYGIAVAISLVTFCCLLKWQPWITRLQLGMFILAIPPVSVAISSLPILPAVVALWLGIQSWSPIINNQTRPIVGAHSIVKSSPEDVLFANQPGLKATYLQLAYKIAELRPRQVGLGMNASGFEFPLWYVLRKALTKAEMPNIVHELDDAAISSKSDVVFYLDRTPSVQPAGFVEVPGFGELRLYRRI